MLLPTLSWLLAALVANYPAEQLRVEATRLSADHFRLTMALPRRGDPVAAQRILAPVAAELCAPRRATLGRAEVASASDLEPAGATPRYLLQDVHCDRGEEPPVADEDAAAE